MPEISIIDYQTTQHLHPVLDGCSDWRSWLLHKGYMGCSKFELIDDLELELFFSERLKAFAVYHPGYGNLEGIESLTVNLPTIGDAYQLIEVAQEMIGMVAALNKVRESLLGRNE